MAKAVGDYVSFYRREDPTPPVSPILTHVVMLRINNDIPMLAEAEVEVAFHRLRLNKLA